MIHAYKMNGYNIILDQNSGCVHSVDEATYDIITMYESHTKDEIKKYILEKIEIVKTAIAWIACFVLDNFILFSKKFVIFCTSFERCYYTFKKIAIVFL